MAILQNREVPVRPQAGWEPGDSAMVRWKLLNHCRQCLFMLFPLIAIASSGVSRPLFSMSPLASWPLRTVFGITIFWLSFWGFYGISCVTSAYLFWIVFTSSYFWNKALSKEKCECTFSTVFLSSFHVCMPKHIHVCRVTCTYVCTDACGVYMSAWRPEVSPRCSSSGCCLSLISEVDDSALV